jgi:hypothetical protein
MQFAQVSQTKICKSSADAVDQEDDEVGTSSAESGNDELTQPLNKKQQKRKREAQPRKRKIPRLKAEAPEKKNAKSSWKVAAKVVENVHISDSDASALVIAYEVVHISDSDDVTPMQVDDYLEHIGASKFNAQRHAGLQESLSEATEAATKAAKKAASKVASVEKLQSRLYCMKVEMESAVEAGNNTDSAVQVLNTDISKVNALSKADRAVPQVTTFTAGDCVVWEAPESHPCAGMNRGFVIGPATSTHCSHGFEVRGHGTQDDVGVPIAWMELDKEVSAEDQAAAVSAISGAAAAHVAACAANAATAAVVAAQLARWLGS